MSKRESIKNAELLARREGYLNWIKFLTSFEINFPWHYSHVCKNRKKIYLFG